MSELFNIEIESNLDFDLKKKMITEIVQITLENLKPLIIIDGYDEIRSEKLKKIIISEFQSLALALSNARLVLTSRSGDFHYNIDNSNQYEICSLSDSQIKEFTLKWLDSETESNKLFNQLRKSPFYDTTIRPLNLAHLTAIYERDGKVPEKPKTVYKKIVYLLLEDWNRQRSIFRASKYSEFEVDRKFEFLSNLAYYFTHDFGTTTFSKEDLKKVYIEICDNFNLPYNQEVKVASELETHSGLFIQSGFRQYEFAHKSIQEYLTAEYLVGLPNIPNEIEFLLKIPNELALAVAISSNSTLYFHSLIIHIIKREIWKNGFIEIFLNRIVLEKPDFLAIPETAITICYIIETLYENRVVNSKRNQQFTISFKLLNKITRNKLVKQSFLDMNRHFDISTYSKENRILQLTKLGNNHHKNFKKFPDIIYTNAYYHF